MLRLSCRLSAWNDGRVRYPDDHQVKHEYRDPGFDEIATNSEENTGGETKKNGKVDTYNSSKAAKDGKQQMVSICSKRGLQDVDEFFDMPSSLEIEPFEGPLQYSDIFQRSLVRLATHSNLSINNMRVAIDEALEGQNKHDRPKFVRLLHSSVLEQTLKNIQGENLVSFQCSSAAYGSFSTHAHLALFSPHAERLPPSHLLLAPTSTVQVKQLGFRRLRAMRRVARPILT